MKSDIPNLHPNWEEEGDVQHLAAPLVDPGPAVGHWDLDETEPDAQINDSSKNEKYFGELSFNFL